MAHRLSGSAQTECIRLPYTAPEASLRAFFFKERSGYASGPGNREREGEVAEAADVDARTVLNIENYKGNPRMEVLFPLIRALKIDAREIFDPEMQRESPDFQQLRLLIHRSAAGKKKPDLLHKTGARGLCTSDKKRAKLGFFRAAARKPGTLHTPVPGSRFLPQKPPAAHTHSHVRA